jgi:hypothetical protein
MMFCGVLSVLAACDGPCPTAGCDTGGSTGGDVGGTSFPVTLVHTDAAGGVQSAKGAVWVAIDAQEARILRIELTDPVVVAVEDRELSLLTGYPVGTTVEVTTVRLPSSVPFPLDKTGTGTVDAGAPLVLDVVATEPRDERVGGTRYAFLPWALTVTIDTGLAVAPWSDGFGGTFELR